MRDIEAYKKDVPNFGEMFKETEAVDSYGRMQRIYYLNREPHQIKQNYNNNKDRFEEGKHYYKVEGDELRKFKDEVTNSYLVGKNAKLRCSDYFTENIESKKYFLHR